MKIKSVQATWLHVPIAEARPHVSDFGRIASFDSTLVRIETECGLVGWGESKEEVGSAGNNRTVPARSMRSTARNCSARIRATSAGSPS